MVPSTRLCRIRSVCVCLSLCLSSSPTPFSQLFPSPTPKPSAARATTGRILPQRRIPATTVPALARELHATFAGPDEKRAAHRRSWSSSDCDLIILIFFIILGVLDNLNLWRHHFGQQYRPIYALAAVADPSAVDPVDPLARPLPRDLSLLHAARGPHEPRAPRCAVSRFGVYFDVAFVSSFTSFISIYTTFLDLSLALLLLLKFPSVSPQIDNPQTLGKETGSAVQLEE